MRLGQRVAGPVVTEAEHVAPAERGAGVGRSGADFGGGSVHDRSLGVGVRDAIAPRAGGASHDLFVAPRFQLLVCPCRGNSVGTGGASCQTVAKRARERRRRAVAIPSRPAVCFVSSERWAESPEPKSRQPEGARFSGARGALVIDFGAGVGVPAVTECGCIVSGPGSPVQDRAHNSAPASFRQELRSRLTLRTGSALTRRVGCASGPARPVRWRAGA